MTRCLTLLLAAFLATAAAAQPVSQERIDSLVASLEGRGYSNVVAKLDGDALTITAIGAGGEEQFAIDPATGELVPTDDAGISDELPEGEMPDAPATGSEGSGQAQ